MRLYGILRIELRSSLFKKTSVLFSRIARIEDIKRGSLFKKTVEGKKRKREDDLLLWISDSGMLLEKVEHVLNAVGKDRNFLKCARMRKIVEKKIEALKSHEKKGDGQGRPNRGAHIPVKELVGQVASIYLEKLQALLMDDKAGRIAIPWNARNW